MAGLLVSVRSAGEVAAALEGGASLIDVKEPANGALGRADDAVREAVLDAVAGRVPVSAAMGELFDFEELEAESGLRYVRAFRQPTLPVAGTARLAYVKYGLRFAQWSDWPAALIEVRRSLDAGPCRLVVTAYADADSRPAFAPSPEQVVSFAIREQAAVFLLDTWSKDRTLLDWMTVAEVADLSWRAWSAGVRVALAGSLGVGQIRALKVAAPDWFAVRGAACAGGERGGVIDAERVRRLVEAAR